MSAQDARDTTGWKDPKYGTEGHSSEQNPPKHLRVRDLAYWQVVLPGYFDDVHGSIVVYPCYDAQDFVYIEILKVLFPGKIHNVGFPESEKTVERIAVDRLAEFSREVRELYERNEMEDRVIPDPELERILAHRLSPGLEWGLTAYAGYEPPYAFTNTD